MPTHISEINVTKHYLTATSEQIKEIAKPLTRFGVTWFDHFRIYDDNSGIDLTTVPDFCELFVNERLYREGCVGNYDEYHDGYYFWDTLTGAREVFKAIEQHNYTSHGIIVIKTYEKFCDQFHFGGDLNNPGVKNFFINCKDIIENFIDYYYSQAADLIANARAHSYSFPNDKKECDELINPADYEREKAYFNKYVLSESPESQWGDIPLTKRELQCIYYSSLGDSAKIVAAHLNIARKTVERHLENARQKLGVRNKVGLLKVVSGWCDIDKIAFLK